MLNYSANGPSGYNLTNSLRFRSSASAYLNRTFATPTNNKIWTLSLWVKRSTLTSTQILLATSTEELRYISDGGASGVVDSFQYNYGAGYGFRTSATYRDPSAWYHLVIATDTTQATAANRVKFYVNGVQATTDGTYDIAQNANTQINSAVAHNIARRTAGSLYFDGYMTEVNFIDGQQLTPSSFGNTNSVTGVWQPAKYTGTYGTNGFYLNFTDIALTSGSNTGLGKDNSSNGNYWNTNNISVTAGTTYDAMTDVPTNTSATVANYCVINPLSIGSSVTISNGNLTFTNSAGTHRMIIGSMASSSGKFYAEFTVTSLGDTYPQIGIVDPTQWSAASQPGAVSRGWGYLYDGRIFNNNSAIDSGEPTYTNGDIIGVAFDLTNNKVYFSKNGTFINSADPAAGTNGYSITSGYDYAFSMSSYDTSTDPVYNLNFGQRPFQYTPPTGFVALNTYNLPTPTILQGNKYMDATLYTGNGSTQSITNAGAFKPDFVWIKTRSTTYNNNLQDSVRGAGKILLSNATNAEFGNSGDLLTSFNSNGFTVNNTLLGGSDPTTDGSGQTFVGWQWQAGQGTTSSNTQGSITSTVSVNASAGFSIVTYTGTGANATVGHGLGVAPKMIIVKRRDNAVGGTNWYVYHSGINGGVNPQQYNLKLNLTNAQAGLTAAWNDTAPTSSVFTVGTQTDVNGSAGTFVAYAWAEIAGFSKFGSYTGNGSADGTFVATNFAPKYVMIKRTDSTSPWNILDTSINPYNVGNKYLQADSSQAEGTFTTMDMLSNGFKLRSSDATHNANGGTYIYACFASNPFKNSLAR